ncbi:MAG: hypothetical protein FJ313_01245 [Gemmatimonadetes bacterium]|nr:hypothetical protein [Gemmatimonadota bacterium]
MNSRTLALVAVAVACLAVCSARAQADTVRVWGTCSAVRSQNPQHPGEWEYTLDMGWDATGWEPEPLWQVVLFTDLASCPCVSEPAYFGFPYSSGIGTGKNGVTTHYYYTGYFYEGGSQRFADSSPAVLFTYADTSSELNIQGSARLVFMSTARPGELSAKPEGLGIIAGEHEARGEVTGVFPSCDCGNTPTESGTWGTIKAIFR